MKIQSVPALTLALLLPACHAPLRPAVINDTAASTPASLLVQVTDSAGLPLGTAGVSLWAASDSILVRKEEWTSVTGEVLFPGLHPGTYGIRVRRLGFVPRRIKTALTPGETKRRVILSGYGQDIGCEYCGSPMALYPYGDAADIYEALLETESAGANSRLLVIADSTIPASRGSASEIDWMRSHGGPPRVSEETIKNFLTENEYAEPITAHFGYKIPISLLRKPVRDSIFPRNRPLGKAWEDFYGKFPGSSGIITFSKVGFNSDHSEAIVEMNVACGGLCGHGGLYTLNRVNGKWIVHRPKIEWTS